MASLSNDANGERRILFIDGGGVRRVIRPGKKVTKKQAESITSHVEYLNQARITRQPVNPETASWVAKLDAKLRAKLERAGLVDPVEVGEPKPELPPSKRLLGPFIDAYIEERRATGSKPRSVDNYKQARRTLCEYFGEDKPLTEITEADAERWRRWMASNTTARKIGKASKALAPNTYNRRCGFARQFFNAALNDRIITANPFRALKGIAVKANRDREYFLSREDADKILDKCPDAEWRLLFVLARYGGLRCPSETHALTWGDVDWVGNRLTVHVPKLEHRGKEFATRVVPLFPEVRAELEDCFALAGERGVDPKAPIIARYRNVPKLRNQFIRIIELAELKPWEKLFQNLRSTRQTELAQKWPLHNVCRWLGNSEAVAKEHYLQTTDADFEAAARGDETADVTADDDPELDGGKPAQKPAQSTAMRSNPSQSAVTLSSKSVGKCDNRPVSATSGPSCGVYSFVLN